MKILSAIVGALLLTGASAHATCISAVPISAPDLTAGTPCSINAGDVDLDIVFGYKAAADIDLLSKGVTLIANTDPIGTHVTLTGLTIGQDLGLDFRNNDTATDFRPGILGPDGFQHIAVRGDISDFQSDPPRSFLTPANLGPALAVMTSIAPLADWFFVGLEDLTLRQGSDFDFNDLIFAMHASRATVNEPGTLAVLGLGLIGIWGARHLRVAQAV